MTDTPPPTPGADKKRLFDEIDAKRIKLADRLIEMENQLAQMSMADAQRQETLIEGIKAQLRLLNRITLPVYQASRTDYRRSVFVSYVADEEGKRRFRQVEGEFKSDYEIRTGFGRERENQVVENIADLIARSSAFLGIWTLADADLSHAATKGASSNCSPGAWLPLELGMAIALHKPFRIVVDARIRKDWYLKPLQGIIHSVFDDSAAASDQKSFREKLRTARIALDQRLEERLYISSGADPNEA